MNTGRKHNFAWVKMPFKRGLAVTLTVVLILVLLAPAMAFAGPAGYESGNEAASGQHPVNIVTPDNDGADDEAAADASIETPTQVGEVGAEEPAAQADSQPTDEQTAPAQTGAPQVDVAGAEAPTASADVQPADEPAASAETEPDQIAKAAEPQVIQAATPPEEKTSVNRADDNNGNDNDNGNTGSIKTTDVNGDIHGSPYDTKQDVYVKGSNFPVGDYYLQVTNPNGSDVLGRSTGTVHVGDDGVLHNVQLWAILKSDSSGLTTGGYDDSPNNGDDYKVWVSQSTAFNENESKTDNFSVKQGETTEPPEPETTYTISKTDSSDPVYVNENTTYTITVRNTGDTTLSYMRVYDDMPSGLTYSGAIPSPDETSPLMWEVPSLGPDGVYEIKVAATALTVGDWTNRASARYSEYPDVYAFETTKVKAKTTSNETTPSLTPVSTPAPVAPVVAPATYDLSISKVDDVDPAYVGDTVTYTMTVKNIGDQPLTGLAFRDTLPTGMTFKSSSTTDIKQSTVGAYAWSLKTLAPGESRKFTISTTANAVGNWKNTVSVTAKELPTAVQAAERTQVLALVAQAPQTIVSDANTGNSSLPLTGFPLTAWWLATATMIAAGLWLEISTRRKKRLS